MGKGQSAHIHNAATRILVIGALVLLLTTLGSAFSVSFVEPQDGNVSTGDQGFNVSVPTDENVTNVNITHNQTDSGDFTESIATLYNETDTQAYFNTTKDTSTILDDGYAWINATALSAVGVRNGTVIRITVDNDDPTVTLHNPENDTFTNDDSPTLDVTGPEPMVRWDYSVNGTGNTSFSPNTTTIDLSQGENNITIWANDTAGNLAMSTINVTVDTQDPTATDTLGFTSDNSTAFRSSKLNDNTLNTDHILDSTTVGLNWSDQNTSTDFADSGLSGFNDTVMEAKNASFDLSSQALGDWSSDWYIVNGSVAEHTNQTIADELASGHAYQFRLRSTDRAGNEDTTDAVTVAVDTDRPQFAENSSGHIDVEPYAWTADDDPELDARITDLVGMDKSSIMMNITNTSDSWGKQVNLTDLGDADKTMYDVVSDVTDGYLNLTHNQTYNVTVNATDLFGQYATLNWTFQTDFKKPDTVSIKEFETANGTYTDSDGNIWYRDEHTIQVTCSDDVSEPGAFLAVGDGNKQGGWNSSLDSQNRANVTLTEHSDIEYTFKCKDRAGNINDTVTETFYIDRQSPDVIDGESTVEDNDKGVELDFDFEANFSDDTGINVSASSVSLERTGTQDGQLDDEEWNASEMSMNVEVEDLDAENWYTLDLTVVDNVGKTENERIEFRTKEKNDTTTDSTSEDDGGSSSGGGSSSISSTNIIAFNSIPSGLQLNQGESTSFDIKLMNRANVPLTGVTINIYSGDSDSDITFTPEENDFEIENKSIETVSVDVDAGSTPEGRYTADVYVETDEGLIISEDITVKIGGVDPELEVSGPEEAHVNRNGTEQVAFTVENTGGVADNVTVNLSVDDVPAEPVDTVESIGADTEETVTFRLVPANDTEIGAYDGSLTVSYDENDVTYDFTVKVQPVSREIQKELDLGVDRIQQMLDENRTELAEDERRVLQSMLREARRAIDDGDYVAAASVRNDIEQQYDLEVAPASGPAEQGGLPLVPAAAVLLFAGMLATLGYGAVTYEEELHDMLESGRPDGYAYMQDEQEAVGNVVTAVKGGVLTMVQRINGAARQVRTVGGTVGQLELPAVTDLFASGSDDTGGTSSYTPPSPQTPQKQVSLQERFGGWFDAISVQAYPYQLFEYMSRGMDIDIDMNVRERIEDTRSQLEEKRTEYEVSRSN